MQTEINFESPSPINVIRLTGQNLRLYEYLLTGKAIHCFHPAMRDLRIGYLNSRASDLLNKHNVPISKRRIKVEDVSGQLVDVVEYSLQNDSVLTDNKATMSGNHCQENLS